MGLFSRIQGIFRRYRSARAGRSWGLYSVGTAFVLFGVGAALFLCSHEETVSATQAVEPSLSCHDIYRIFYWSRDHFGGGNASELFGKQTGERTLDLFLQKLDPYKLLFTAGEAAAFRSEGLNRWNELVSSQRCDYFDTWTQGHWNEVRRRFEKTLAETPIDAFFTPAKAAGADASAELHLAHPVAYAASESDLRIRVRAAMKQVAALSTAPLLAAYRQDRGKMIRDTLEQGLFGDAPISPRTLLVKSLLGSLDTYSTYFSSQEFEDFYHDLAGGTSGIGIKVRPVPNGLLIEKLISDSPAEASGKIKAGDVIVGIDGVSLAGLPPAASRGLLKGEEHTWVSLRLRSDSSERTIRIERERFSFDDGKITGRVVPQPRGAIGVIDIPSFYGRAGRGDESERSSSEDLRNELGRLLDPRKRVEAMVLDLRGNPGGFLEEAVSMAGFFLGDRPVVAVVENHRRRIMKESQAHAIYEGPLVVLVDADSASASEVLTGALKDYQRAVVVGSPHTYGKGCVQRLFHLDDQFLDLEMGLRSDRGVVKLTTSVFYSPLGHSPANGGVASDIALSMKGTADDDGDAPPREATRVPEEGPVVSPALTSQIKELETIHRSEIAYLMKRQQSRAKASAPSAAALAAEELRTDDSKGADAELTDAIAIAGDLATLERKPIGPQVTRK